MSFQDLESGSQRTTCHSQTDHEESSYQHDIKVNIQKMQETARLINEQIERAQKTCMSQRVKESLNKYLQSSHKIARETEQLFRDWTVHLAGEPGARHKKKFAYEKLETTFKDEVANLRDAPRRALAVRKKTATTKLPCNASSGVGLNSCQDHSRLPGEEEHCLLAASRKVRFSSQDEVMALPSLDRTEDTKGARDFLVTSDVQEETCSFSRTAGSKNRTERRRLEFERLCCAFALAMLVMYFMLAHHLHPQSLSLTKIAGIPSWSPTGATPPGQQALILDNFMRRSLRCWGMQLL